MKAIVTSLVSVLMISTASLAGTQAPVNQSYLLIRKEAQAFAVDRCQITEAQSSLQCRKVAELSELEIKAMRLQMQETIHKQNLKIGAIVVGGVIVGTVVVAAGGGLIVFAASQIVTLGGPLGAVGALLDVGGGAIVGGGVGAVGGGVSAHSLGNVIFSDHQSDKVLVSQFESLIKAGTPIVIQQSNPSAKEVQELIGQFEAGTQGSNKLN